MPETVALVLHTTLPSIKRLVFVFLILRSIVHVDYNSQIGLNTEHMLLGIEV